MNDTPQTLLTEEPPKPLSTVADLPKTWQPFADRANAQPKRAGILSQVTVRKRKRPVLAILVGPHGVGKSTFAATLPDPIVIAAERIDQINVSKLPVPRTFKELYKQIEALDKEEHNYKSIILDSVDATDLLIVQHVLEEGRVRSLEQYGGGYQKGALRCREIWAGLLAQIRDMSERFNILLIAGAHVKSFSDPLLSAPYDRWNMKLQDKSAELLRQMSDIIMFVNLETVIEKDTPKSRKGKGILTGDRVLYTQPTTGFEAKSRYNHNSPLEFSWEAVQAGIDEFYAK